MTRAEAGKPTRRLVRGRGGDEYVLEGYAEYGLLRPKGSRSAKVQVRLDWGRWFQRALVAQLEEAAREKRKARRKGSR